MNYLWKGAIAVPRYGDDRQSRSRGVVGEAVEMSCVSRVNPREGDECIEPVQGEEWRGSEDRDPGGCSRSSNAA